MWVSVPLAGPFFPGVLNGEVEVWGRRGLVADRYGHCPGCSCTTKGARGGYCQSRKRHYLEKRIRSRTEKSARRLDATRAPGRPIGTGISRTVQRHPAELDRFQPVNATG